MTEKIRTGVVIGLAMATFYAAYALLLFMVSGPEPFSKNETSFGAVILTYYSAGLIGGAIVGAMSPLGRSWPGRILLGILVGLVFFFCVSVAMHGPFWVWKRDTWENLVVLGLLFGVVGSAAWSKATSL